MENEKPLSHVGFDPDEASDGQGLFGLPHSEDEASICVIAVPFEGTTSYRQGTAGGPAAIFAASHQIDLHHHLVGDKIWKSGVFYSELASPFERWNQSCKENPDPKNVNPISEAIENAVYKKTQALYQAKKTPVILGGEHSVPLGAMKAALEAFPNMGVLQFDAHADLREAYEGYTQSHASIFYNLCAYSSFKGPLVQVGIRDYSQSEAARIADDARIVTYFDRDIAERGFLGESFASLANEIIAKLPHEVWVSFDIDGLDPALCPHTGTPVVGGLLFNQVVFLLKALVQSGRRVIGADLCEVSQHELDADVGARVLYELCAATVFHKNP